MRPCGWVIKNVFDHYWVPEGDHWVNNLDSAHMFDSTCGAFLIADQLRHEYYNPDQDVEVVPIYGTAPAHYADDDEEGC